MKKIKIRMAEEQDAEKLLQIYAPYILNTAVSFEYEVPTVEEFRKRIHNIKIDYPYIVCEEGSEIIGYAYAHKMYERAAYQWNAELSIYMKENYTGHGIGTSMYSVLLQILKLQNVQNVFGCVTTPNEKSERLHKKMGFITSGVFHKTGFKLGEWHDITWFEKTIGERSGHVSPLRSIQEIAEDRINKILERENEKIKDRVN